MTDAIITDGAKTPRHLWIFGGLSALWNAFGAFDYVMTQTHNQVYLADFTVEQRAFFDSFPAWMEGAWAFGVWGALCGSLLLLARSRHAVTAFGVSLAGLAVSTAYRYVFSTPPAEMQSTSMMLVNLAIWAIAIALLVYARKLRASGVLR